AFAAEVRLADGGKALLRVVVSERASPATRKVAAELAGYLGTVAGCKFEVTAGDGRTGIVVGTLAEFPAPGLAKALEVRNRFDGKEAFGVRSEGNRLLLLGATALGASHAAYRLLERIGCRWFFPAAEWEVLPRQADLRVDIDEAG